MIPVIIACRLDSSRLPRKLLLDFGGIPVVEHVVRRCEHFGFRTIICCNHSQDAETFSKSTTCKEVFGTDATVETAMVECAVHYNINTFHQIDADDPFFDRDSVIESMQCFMKGKFNKIKPSIYSQSGTGMVGISYNLQAPADSVEGILPDPRMTIWPLRLTLDYDEDYHLLSTVNRAVGGYMAPWKAIEDLFIRNPDLHKINWHRNSEWKARQYAERNSL